MDPPPPYTFQAEAEPPPPAQGRPSFPQNPQPYQSYQSLITHNQFYDYRVVKISVQETIHTISRPTLIRESPYFKRLIEANDQTPSSSSPVPNVGGDQTQPITLEVSLRDFEQFLRVLCPPVFGKREYLTFEEWIIVLKFARRYDFPNVRKEAVRAVPGACSRDPIALIKAGQGLNVKSWQITGANVLVQRESPLTVREGQELGWEYFVSLVGLREKRIRRSVGKTAFSPQSDMTSDIRDQLGI